MPKNQIFCRKCNEKFNSLVDFASHICSKETISPKWDSRVGRRGGGAENKAHKQYLDDHWLVQAERQRRKKIKLEEKQIK